MYDVFIIVTLPLIWIALNISSFIIILLHELSHAVPALIFTKSDVKIYIGIYGDNSAPKLTIGRLTIYARPKFSYLKNRGICFYRAGTSLTWQVIILLTAPLIIMAIAYMLFGLLVFTGYNIYIKGWVACALAPVIINLVVNLFPKKIHVKDSPRLHYSDGYHIILLLESKSNYCNIITACMYFDDGDFVSALVYLNKVSDKYMDESVFSLVVACQVQLMNYDGVLKNDQRYEHTRWHKQISAHDYCNLGYAGIQLKQHQQALAYLNRSVTLEPHKFDSLYNRGLVHNMLGNYTQAKDDLKNALFINETSADAYGHLAFSNLKSGRHGEALTDIEKALSLDNNNAAAYVAMGIYMREKENITAATENIERARQLAPAASFIDEYLER